MNDSCTRGPVATEAGSAPASETADNTFCIGEGESPQAREYAGKPGSYSLVSRTSRANVDPGDALNVELFITGYGVIKGAKLLVYPSPGIYDVSKSSLTAGCRIVDNRLIFGGQSWPMHPGCSFWIELESLGVKTHVWNAPNFFCDVKQNAHLILTETAFPWTPPEGEFHGPVSLSLKMSNNVKPGQYDVRFVLTYYDGESWVTSSEAAQFSVRTWYQRNETFCQIMAISAAVIALLALVLQVVMK